MPYKSDSQRRFFHSPGAAKAGITKKDIKHWDDASRGQKNLPEHVKKASFESFCDELLKIAVEGSPIKDFLAGINPGEDLYDKGMQEANISEHEAKKRKTLVALGGFLSGSLLAQPIYSAAMEGAHMATKGPKAALVGIGKGFISPFTSIGSSIKNTAALKKIFPEHVTSADVRAISKMVEDPVIQELITSNAASAAKALSKNPQLLEQLQRTSKNQTIGSLATLGVSGMLGAGGAYAQYDQGREIGKRLTEKT
jgi:hypothetical protein